MAASLSALTMVESVKISNFRGFKQLEVDGLELVNIIVGNNAVGKTAFLEAVYLAVSGSAQQPFSLKQWRSQDVKFQATSGDSVVEAFYADLFHDAKSGEPISIELKGRGFENRELAITRSPGNAIASTEGAAKPNRHARRSAKHTMALQQVSQVYAIPISLTWTDQAGFSHATRALISSKGLEFEGTNEQLPNCYLFAAQTGVPASEAAIHFSTLKKRRRAEPFRRVFMSVFPEIRDIDLGDVGNSSVLIADVPWAKELLPLSLISGGTNRAAAILLAITHRENGLVMVDEIENGLFHARQRALSTALLELARIYQTQLLLTTHSEEFIRNFLEASVDNFDGVAFWRMERTEDNMPIVRKFTATEFKSGLAAGEMR